MKYAIMIYEIHVNPTLPDIMIWHGNLNSKCLHAIRKRMAAYFDQLRSERPFANTIDIGAIVLNGDGAMEPVLAWYGGHVCMDAWQMYTSSYWGYHRIARWEKPMSPDELKIYLNSKYDRTAERLRFGDVNYNVRNDVYFDSDSVRGGDPD